MKGIKNYGVFVIVFVLIVALVGCSSSPLQGGQAPQSNGLVENGSGNVSAPMDKQGVVLDGQTGLTNKSGTNSPQINRKIIKNGQMTIETTDVNNAYAIILAFAKKNGGYEFSRTRTKDGDYTTIIAEIKIRPELLDSMMVFSGKEGEIIISNVTSEDITAAYTDTKIRLKTKEATLVKYYEFLAKAKNISQTLEIQSYINSITEEIEAAKGEIKMWDALVNEATLTLTIQQKNDPIKATKPIKWDALTIDDMGKMISNGFITIVNTFVSIIQWLVIGLLSLSPLLILAALVFLLIRRKIKKNSTKGNKIE